MGTVTEACILLFYKSPQRERAGYLEEVILELDLHI